MIRASRVLIFLLTDGIPEWAGRRKGEAHARV